MALPGQKETCDFVLWYVHKFPRQVGQLKCLRAETQLYPEAWHIGRAGVGVEAPEDLERRTELLTHRTGEEEAVKVSPEQLEFLTRNSVPIITYPFRQHSDGAP